MDGRDYVLPEDIKEVALDVMNHRILLNYEAEADAVKTSDIIKALLSKVPINNRLPKTLITLPAGQRNVILIMS